MQRSRRESTTLTMRRTTVLLATTTLTLTALGGCGSADEEAALPTPGTQPFLEGLDATLVLPADVSGEVPLVVLVPGGGWFTADLEGFPELAQDLADRGAAVVTMVYRTSDSGEYFPVPVEDVACGFAYAVDATEGLDVSQAVLGGHSSGANMAALVALAPDDFASSECPYASAAPDAFIGISGPYDITQAFPPVVEAFFGPDRADPATWDDGNPTAHADQRPEVSALLMHGAADDMVPTTFTDDFAAELTDGGHDVTTDYPADADHFSVIRPDVAGPAIADWLGLS